MIFLASLIFIVLFYVLPLRRLVINNFELFPVLGRRGSFVPTALLIYLALLLLIYFVWEFQDFIYPGFRSLIRRRLQPRTGIYGLEVGGFWLSLTAVIIFLAVDWTLLPLGLAAAAAFLSLFALPVTLRPVGLERRARPSPRPRRVDSGTVEAERDTVEVRRYEWQWPRRASEPFFGRLELSIVKKRYEKAAAANSYKTSTPVVRNYRHFVNEGITPEVVSLVEKLSAVANDEGFSAYDEIANVIGFVRSIPYNSDERTKGKTYLRYPLETLYEQTGDENCRAILAAAILKEMNHEVLILESRDETAVAVAGAEGLPGRFFAYYGRKYYYGRLQEKTGGLGELPADKAMDTFKVFTV